MESDGIWLVVGGNGAHDGVSFVEIYTMFAVQSERLFEAELLDYSYMFRVPRIPSFPTGVG